MWEGEERAQADNISLKFPTSRKTSESQKQEAAKKKKKEKRRSSKLGNDGLDLTRQMHDVFGRGTERTNEKLNTKQINTLQ